MVGLSMFETISIKSTLKDYEVFFSTELNYIINKFQDFDSFYIIDKQVYGLYFGDQISIPRDRIFLIEATEINKTGEFSLGLIEELIHKDIKRSSKLIAIGGGIIQDVTSFIASILYRGIDWIFVPTTLLAQADSCIGGKSSINFKNIKNILGTFNPPTQIYVNISFLNSLSVEDIKSGIGEMLHYFFYSNSPFAEKLKNDYGDLIENRSLLSSYIRESLLVKKTMIEIDEFDKGPRRVFNYGHTFGHALESLTNYEINHGLSVTIGMGLANYISLELGFLPKEEYVKMQEIIEINFPTFSMKRYSLEQYINFLSKDKKNTSQKLTCILTRGRGKLFIHELEMNEAFKRLIEKYFLQFFP